MASRILLADDSITIQKVVNLTFADEGIEVVAVSSGDLAERRLPEVSPDLVLADIFMPGKNGYELCEAIKENAQFRHVPVVLLVGAFEPFDQAEANRVKADAHLTKPFESRTLVETVRRLISASWRAGTGQSSAASMGDDENDKVLDALSPLTPPASFAVPSSQIDLSAMGHNNGDGSESERSSTGELASSSTEPQDVLEIGFEDVPVMPRAGVTHITASEHWTSESLPGEAAFSPEQNAPIQMSEEEMLQDFDTGEPLLSVSSQDPDSFEPEPVNLLDVDGSSAGEGESWYQRAGFDPVRVDRTADDGWPVSSHNYPLSDFDVHPDGSANASIASGDTACATLLAVDEPLGDVLFDEAVSAEQLSLSYSPAADSPGLELNEPEATQAPSHLSTQFDLVEVSEQSSPDASLSTESSEFSQAPPVEHAAAEFEAAGVEEPSPLGELDAVGETRFHLEQTEPVKSSFASESEDVPQLGDVSVNSTTPVGTSDSEAEVEASPTPMGTAESVEELPAEQVVADEENSGEAGFATATMWTDEEARFTPIDIEAVVVEEAPAAEIGEAKTGFAVSSVLAEEAPASTETVRAPSEESVNQTASLDLSSATIDEIVRRVVAELSQSVVREVAWEVVPDCVERVIDKLTRESLSKRQ